MANALTDRVPPAKLAARGQVIEKTGVLSDLPRLREVVRADLARLAQDRVPAAWRQAPVDIKLKFGWADVGEGIPALEGRVSARVDAVCQRCLEPFALSLVAQLKLTLLIPGDDLAGCEQYEVWETAEDTVRPLDIVDEALIMALPLSATHGDRANCGPLAEILYKEATGKERPFADLKSQMRGSHR